MEEIAYAKINLALHVRARRPDDYHQIETVFAFAEEGDRLSVAEGQGLTLEVTGPFAEKLGAEADNLVLRAARALRERFGIEKGARLALDKRLPVAAGLGGGSADAAAALRLLLHWWELEVGKTALFDIAAALGSDVPACLLSHAARGEGKGDALQPIEQGGLSGTPIVLVNPRVPLPTAAVFCAWDGVDRGPLDAWPEGRNDLQPAAIGIVPEIAQILDSMKGARLARMSGSGATCFGLYDTEAERDGAAAKVAAAHPGWWTLATRLR